MGLFYNYEITTPLYQPIRSGVTNGDAIYSLWAYKVNFETNKNARYNVQAKLNHFVTIYKQNNKLELNNTTQGWN